ncbi:glycerophosphodiester phosphodiesterase family protein [Mariprofundus sp. KV]|uniref:glycerophosphodiester phosphodiesterase family protein n=1 Tax=Mariprofundus sp. KV TaxID=2608715 RepID=UPI0015A02F6D|nr:glycerophosphodiester phosphodiesterase family protein [Mariprofundus sp. KV]NWF36374.1 glycerophosphodiester phosphodiesterase [Mariprofundus sp. KV]
MQMLENIPTTKLVAHRGDRAGGIENTLAAFEYAAARGARYAECDIQFTRDLVAVVIHDNRLERLCNRPDVKVVQTELADLQQICSDHFKLCDLSELLSWLQKVPQLTLFIEIKPPIRRRLTARAIARRLADQIPAPLLQQVVLISQNADIIDACNNHIGCRTGWVAESPRQPSTAFDYIFMSSQQSNTISSWQARGIRVGLYTVNDLSQARALLAAGADLIETDQFSCLAETRG